jgi:outer membrane protein assembly factor BamE (lipoprotein component of BamABCDE complex)
MSKDQVRAILGSPDNTDDEYVWLYIDSMQKDSPDHTWENLEDSKSSYGFYLIFYNDKFVLDNGFPAKVAEDKPNVTMYHATSLSQDQVDKLLADARAKHPPAAAIN